MTKDNITTEEILNFALENGMLNVSDIQKEINMKNRKKILESHAYWQGKNGSWYTYLPDETKGRILKKRKTKQAIEDCIVDYYEKIEEVITFKKCFCELLEMKLENKIIVNNTYSKSMSDYSRMFEGCEFENERIEKINDETITNFIIMRTKELGLRKKAMKALYGYLKSTFFHARAKRYIVENPFDFVNPLKNFYPYCEILYMDESKRIVSAEQGELLQEQFKKDHLLKPDYIPTYAVEFAVLTGMRVGEIAALKWSEVTDQYVKVCREEIYDRVLRKSIVVEYVKNKKPRLIPMTGEIKDFLKKLKETENTFDYLCDYIFADECGRISKRRISDCARNKSIQVGIDIKSIHSHRRTLNSAMKQNGASSAVASAILGNSEEVNDNYYSYDITDFEHKKKLLETAQRTVLSK